MMTRTKKEPHQRLGMSFAEYGALLGTRALLASGQMQHTTAIWPTKTSPAHLFNMGVVCNKNEHCGSVQCIGGTMALILRMDECTMANFVQDENPVFGELFFPPQGYQWATIVPKQAIKAIDNFLATGEPQWEKILRKNQRFPY